MSQRRSKETSRERRLPLMAALALLLLGLLVFFYVRSGAGAKAPSEDDLIAQSSPFKRPPSSPLTFAPGAPPPTSEPEDPSGDSRTLWQKRLARAQHTLEGYLLATRYPPTSRPLEEHPDQGRPHFVSDSTVHLKRQDEKLTDARVTLHQDRYYLVGDERVTFTITCANSEGPAPCEVLSTFVRAEVTSLDGGAPPPAPSGAMMVPFTAGEGGALTGSFQPASQGFADLHGPIRLFIDLRVDGETGQTSFEVMFTPRAPAVFTGSFREVLKDGSLDLYAEVKVDKPGRYVIAARADDADGRSFGYLSFNEEVPAGVTEVKLRLFGKLIVDQKARSPFHLRDIDGFLLREDAYPDRELMPSLSGVVYTTKRYADRDFSDQEWQSEEKDRHVREFTKDVDETKQHVAAGE